MKSSTKALLVLTSLLSVALLLGVVTEGEAAQIGPGYWDNATSPQQCIDLGLICAEWPLEGGRLVQYCCIEGSNLGSRSFGACVTPLMVGPRGIGAMI